MVLVSLRDEALAGDKIGTADVELLHLTDDLDDVVERIARADAERQG